jgi:hypothetical protein
MQFSRLKFSANTADTSHGRTSAWKPVPATIESVDLMQQHPNKPIGQNLEKRSKFGYSLFFPLVVTGFMGIVLSSWANSTYLSSVGPSPFRYLPISTPSTNRVASPTPAVVQLPVPPPVETVEKPPLPAPPTPAPSPAPGSDQTQAVVESPQSDGVISPQILLKYFNKSTNGAAAAVSGPIDFSPPRVVLETPSSKAEYSTPPH